jgi:hypothetical protein
MRRVRGRVTSPSWLGSVPTAWCAAMFLRKLFPRRCDLPIRLAAGSRMILAKSRDAPVPLKSRRQIRISAVRFATWKIKIENAHAGTANSIVRASVCGANHNRFVCGFLLAEIDHDMRDGELAVDCIRTRPEEEIARLELVEFERFQTAAHDCMKIATLANPNVLPARISGHFFASGICQHVIDES